MREVEMRLLRVWVAVLGLLCMLLAGSSALALPAADAPVYLPVVISCPPPASPVLEEIVPPNAEPSYAVNWSAAERAASYLLQRDPDPGFSIPAEAYAGGETSASIKSQGIQTYYFRVRALNSCGVSGWSNSRSVPVSWEREPNDPWNTNANGPLISGGSHFGYQNDPKDIFWFDADKNGTIRVNLTGQSAEGVQLQLYYRPDADPIRVDYRVSPPYAIEYAGEAGRYYVYIYAAGGYNESQPYTLWVEYP
jgi:hypothetical protein